MGNHWKTRHPHWLILECIGKISTTIGQHWELSKHPDVRKKSTNSGEQTGSGSVCFWQPTSSHRPLLKKKSCSEELENNCWKELFEKKCFRRRGSEEAIADVGHPGHPERSSQAVLIDDGQQRSLSSQAVTSESTVTTPSEAVGDWKTLQQVATAWELVATTQREYRRDQCSDERRWRRPLTDDSSVP